MDRFLLLIKGYEPGKIEEERVSLWEYVRNVLATMAVQLKSFGPRY